MQILNTESTKPDQPDNPTVTVEAAGDCGSASPSSGEVIPFPNVPVSPEAGQNRQAGKKNECPLSIARSRVTFPGLRPDSGTGIFTGSSPIFRVRALDSSEKQTRIERKQGDIQRVLGKTELRRSRQEGGVLPSSVASQTGKASAPATRMEVPIIVITPNPDGVASGLSQQPQPPTPHEILNLDSPEEEGPKVPALGVPIGSTAPDQVEPEPKPEPKPQVLAVEVTPPPEKPVVPKPKEYVTTPNYADVARVLMSRLFVAENSSDPSSPQCFNKRLYQALIAVFSSVAGLETGKVHDVAAIPREVSKSSTAGTSQEPDSDTRLEGVEYDEDDEDDEDDLTGYGPFILVTQDTVSILADDKETPLVSVRFEPILDKEKLGSVKIFITPIGFNLPFQCEYVINRWKGGPNDGKAKTARFVVDEREFPAPTYHAPDYEGRLEMLGIIRELVLRIVSSIPKERLHKFTPGVMLGPIFPEKDVAAYMEHPHDAIPSTADWSVLGKEIPYTCVARALGDLLFEESESVEGAPVELKFSSEIFGRLFGPFSRLKREAATGTSRISVEIPERNPWVTVDFSRTNNGVRIAFRLFGLEEQPFLCEIDRATFRVFSQQFPQHPRYGYGDYPGKVEIVQILRELVLRIFGMAHLCDFNLNEFSPGEMGVLFDDSIYRKYATEPLGFAPRPMDDDKLRRFLHAIEPKDEVAVPPLASTSEGVALQEADPENPSHVEAFFVSQQLDAGLSDKAWKDLLTGTLMPNAKRFVRGRCQSRGFDAGLVRLATEVTASLPSTEPAGRVDLQDFEPLFNERLGQLKHGADVWRRLVGEVEKKTPAELRLTLNVDGCGDNGRFLDVSVVIEDGTAARVTVHNRSFPVAQADRTSMKNAWVKALGSLKAALREKVCKVEFCMGVDGTTDVARVGRTAITPKFLQQLADGSEVSTMLDWARIEDRFTLRQPPPAEEVVVDAPSSVEPMSAEPAAEGEMVVEEGVVDQAGVSGSDNPPIESAKGEEVAHIGVAAPVDQGVVITRRGLGSLFRNLLRLRRKSS